MNEPTRLLDETDSELERALLSAGSSYRVRPELRAKTLAALGVAGATALSAGVASSATLSAAPPALASSSILAKLGFAKTLAAVATVSAVTAVPAGYLIWKEARSSEPVPAAAAVKPAAPREAPAAVRVESATQEPEGEGALPPAADAVPAPPLNRAAAKPALTSEALRAELMALDAARAALAAGNGQGALSLLDAYDRGNPRGLLRLEAEVLRIDALAKSGRSDAAQKRAKAFLARHPNSVLASRVRGYTAQ